MAKSYNIPLWKSSPFVRLILPLIVGIIFQWYLQIPFYVNVVCMIVLVAFIVGFNFLPIDKHYQYQWVQGFFINAIIFCLGIFLCWQKDIRNDVNWFGKYYNDSCVLVVKINEPPIVKAKSVKADCIVEAIIQNGILTKVNGKLLIYFSKDDSILPPQYGDKILINGGLQQIKNAGNPGGFNYSRYMIFQQTLHQVYLKKDKYILLDEHKENKLYALVFEARQAVINTLQKYIVGNKKVTGIAEALLIGYKEDLDKDVVQEYSNTGVVHIIAISGMHLGLIYVGLVWLFSRLPFVKSSAITRVILILGCLWMFSLITGASASVLRSAVMFTCIIIGKEFFKQASIYNSLASSAFLLLCYNPFLLWDVGFQLSYFAVVGIVFLQKPLQNLYYTKNKAIQYLWQMCSITIAAQILTLPICIYYFHQIPTTFLFTNLICVPLSTAILFAEIALVIFTAFLPLATLIGKFIYVLTWSMNALIAFFNKLPFSLLDKIYATAITTWVLYGFVILLAAALLRKNKMILKISLGFLFLFVGLWAYGKTLLTQQKKMIVYNVSKHTAVDFVSNNKYWFYGDEEFRVDGALQNFNLKPARVNMQVEESTDTLKALAQQEKIWQFYDKKLLIIDTAIKFETINTLLKVDVLLICKNPKVSLYDFTTAVKPAIVVLDASNSMWKIAQWKKECEALHLPIFITNEQGAFVINAK